MYVDDILVVFELIKFGLRWDRARKTLIGNLETEQQDKEGQKSQEVHTMELLAEISSGIISCLNFTWDSSCKNSNRMMKVLDTYILVGIPKRI